MVVFPWKRGPQHRNKLDPNKGYDRRLEDGGFSEEQPNDEKLYDRSYKVNPTDDKTLKRNPKFEPTPDEATFRLSRRGKIPRGT